MVSSVLFLLHLIFICKKSSGHMATALNLSIYFNSFYHAFSQLFLQLYKGLKSILFQEMLPIH